MARKPDSSVVDQMSLPMWPQSQRGMPNSLARSALFSVANTRKGERKHYRRHLIAAVEGLKIEYSGDELRQDDADVWMQITHMARLHPLGTEVEFVAHAMLRELGWTPNVTSYERLRDCLERLKATGVTVSLVDDSKGYNGSLVRSFAWRDADGPLRMWKVLLEKQIIALFGDTSYSRIDWELRLSLPPLAKWLHSFYIGHATPYRFKVETLHRLCGSEQKQLRNFRASLRNALELLVDKGFLLRANVCARTDLVSVERAPRHLVIQ